MCAQINLCLQMNRIVLRVLCAEYRLQIEIRCTWCPARTILHKNVAYTWAGLWLSRSNAFPTHFSASQISLQHTSLERPKQWHLSHNRMTFAAGHMQHDIENIHISLQLHDNWFWIARYVFVARANKHLCECQASNFSHKCTMMIVHVLYCFAATCIFSGALRWTIWCIGHHMCTWTRYLLFIVQSNPTFTVNHLAEQKYEIDCLPTFG